MPSRPPRTLLEVIHGRTGSLRKTFRVGKVVTQWAIARDGLGQRPYVHEYADWWKISERTAWREMAIFSEAFPEEDGPDRMAQWVLEHTDGRPDEATALSVPPVGLLRAA